jgi:YbbR domain-containing protein
MNTEPERNPAQPKTAARTLRAEIKLLPNRLWHILYHNLLWKLLALILALCLWAGLITQDPTLTRERVFTDVPVSVTGSDTLRRNGLIVISGADTQNELVRLHVEVPQREYTNVTASNYNPRIDLTRITATGEQILKIIATSTTTYGNVTEISPDTVTVLVDNYVTNYRVPVTVHQVGDFPSGYYGTSQTLDPSTITVSGPESIVSQIARVSVTLDVSVLPAQSGLVRTALPFQYEDANGNLLDDTLLEASSSSVLLRSIVVEEQLYPVKSLSLSTLALTTGTPAEGYEVKSVTFSPSTLIAAGSDTALAWLDTLFLDKAVDVSGLSASFTSEVKVRKPLELAYLSAESVMVSVEIAPVMLTRTFDSVALNVTDIGDGLSATSETRTVSVTVTGPQLAVAALQPSALQASVSALGLTEGTYAAQVQLRLLHTDDATLSYTASPQNVNLVVAAQ